MTGTHFADVRILTADGLSGPVSVTVADGRIADICAADSYPPDAEVVVGRSRVLLPGLIDAHVHLSGPEQLDALAAHGITTAIDMASWPAGTTAALRSRTGGTQIRSAGVPVIGPAGPHARFGMPDHAVVTDPTQAQAAVARRLADGSDFIKIVTEPDGGGGPPPSVVRAVVAAAHAAGVLVVAHVTHVESFALAVDAGVDVVTHVPFGAAAEATVVGRTRAAIPTLTVSRALTAAVPGRGDYADARSWVAAMDAHRVPIAAGTDANDVPAVPFSIPFGGALQTELALLVDAGLTPLAALAAATTVPATLFGLSDRGTVAVGMRADLILVDGDPTIDITDIERIDGVWIGGRRLRPSR